MHLASAFTLILAALSLSSCSDLDFIPRDHDIVKWGALKQYQMLMSGGERTGRQKRASKPFNQTPSAVRLIGSSLVFNFGLIASDADSDTFEYLLDTNRYLLDANLSPPKLKHGNVSISADGKVRYETNTLSVTGKEPIYFIIRETTGKRLETKGEIEVRIESRSTVPADIQYVGKQPVPNNDFKLKMWHIAALTAGVALFFTLVIVGLTWSCCAWMYQGPMSKPSSIYPGPNANRARKISRMENPLARPTPAKLYQRENVRSGAADDIPYYGARIGGGVADTWKPPTPQYHERKRRTTTAAPPWRQERFYQEEEEEEEERQRRKTVAHYNRHAINEQRQPHHGRLSRRGSDHNAVDHHYEPEAPPRQPRASVVDRVPTRARNRNSTVAAPPRMDITDFRNMDWHHISQPNESSV